MLAQCLISSGNQRERRTHPSFHSSRTLEMSRGRSRSNALQFPQGQHLVSCSSSEGDKKKKSHLFNTVEPPVSGHTLRTRKCLLKRDVRLWEVEHVGLYLAGTMTYLEAHHPERPSSILLSNSVFTSRVILRFAFLAKITVPDGVPILRIKKMH